jgi:MFS family permease
MSVATKLTSRNEAALRFTAGYAFLTSITFSMVASAPTPIYRIYQETLGLTPLAITLIFAIYAITMVVAFLTVARLSDFVGRKPMILAALLLNALALVLFIEADTSTVLMVARAVQGIATGIALATLGALITDAAPKAAATLNSVTALIGLMVGSLARAASSLTCRGLLN